jgi:hypothetical protein
MMDWVKPACKEQSTIKIARNDFARVVFTRIDLFVKIALIQTLITAKEL